MNADCCGICSLPEFACIGRHFHLRALAMA
jgi:hypothetical protein